jgi:hypothetical protein
MCEIPMKGKSEMGKNPKIVAVQQNCPRAHRDKKAAGSAFETKSGELLTSLHLFPTGPYCKLD